mmetsp:Transcript_17593/g.32182  ORF Transcript_17593/g.32182 Transcript_17593/m.32182 type:complete len:234 (-) Transcript_17593:170-871(-)
MPPASPTTSASAASVACTSPTMAKPPASTARPAATPVPPEPSSPFWAPTPFPVKRSARCVALASTRTSPPKDPAITAPMEPTQMSPDWPTAKAVPPDGSSPDWGSPPVASAEGGTTAVAAPQSARRVLPELSPRHWDRPNACPAPRDTTPTPPPPPPSVCRVARAPTIPTPSAPPASNVPWTRTPSTSPPAAARCVPGRRTPPTRAGPWGGQVEPCPQMDSPIARPRWEPRDA